MLPIQFILLLILASMPVEMAAGASTGSPGSVRSAWLVIGSLLLSQMAVALLVLARTRRAVFALHETTGSSSAITQRTDALFSRARWLTLLITGVHLLSSSMPQTVLYWVDHNRFLTYLPKGPEKHVLLLPELLFLAPAVAAWLAIWMAGYFVEEAVRERGMPYLLAGEKPVHEMPSLWQYLSMQARHNFYPVVFLLIKILIALLALGAVRLLPIPNDPEGAAAQIIATAGSGLILLVILPWILVHLWLTTPLLGPLRTRLDRVAALYRLRFRNILLWRTHNMVINAAILGWLPFARYFLMSDSLLESFSDRQLEAVFAHEVGHGKHWHIPWYLATGLGAFALAAGMTGILAYLLRIPNDADLVINVLGIALICLFGGLSLPFIAPRFEHQADWFACRHMMRVLREEPQIAPAATLPSTVVMAQVDALPAELRWTLSTLPTAAETVTMQQYAAGDYPHAPEIPASPATPPAAPPPRVEIQKPLQTEKSPLAPPPFTGAATSAAGAEIFISALDAIVETSHRSRQRRGLMHPSVNDRIALLRRLATNEDAVARFNRVMLRTRLFIVGLLLAGIGAAIIAYMLPDVPVRRANITGDNGSAGQKLRKKG